MEYRIPLKSAFGDCNQMLRAEMRGKGCRTHGDSWICPNEAVWNEFKARLAPAGQPVKQQLQQPVAPTAPTVPMATLPPPVQVKPKAQQQQQQLPLTATLPPPVKPKLELVKPVAIETPVPAPVPAPQAQVQQTEAEKKAVILDLGKALKLEPSRFAVITVPVEPKGWSRPRRRRNLDRKEELGTAEQIMGTKEDTGVEAAKITTTNEQLILNPAEYDNAKKLQSRLGYLLRRLGTCIADGVVVFPLAQEEEFDTAVEDAKTEAKEFNSASMHYEVRVKAFKLEVLVSSEQEIAAQVTYDIRKLLDEMKLALDACDTKRVIEVAEAAKLKAASLAAGSAQGALYAAADAGRKAANKMAKELKDKGLKIEDIKRKLDLKPIEAARLTFLEYSVPVETVAAPAIEASRFADIMNGD